MLKWQNWLAATTSYWTNYRFTLHLQQTHTHNFCLAKYSNKKKIATRLDLLRDYNVWIMSPSRPPCNPLAAPVSGAGGCGPYKALTIALSSQTATSRCRVTFWKLTLAANIGFLSKTAVNKWERNTVSSGIWIEVNVSNTTHLIKRLT